MPNLYPINGLFFYRLIFMALLLLGEGLFCYKLERKDHFYPKLIVGVLACFVLALAYPIPSSNEFYSMAMFMIFFAFTYIVALFLFKADKLMILFCLICGYTIEHLAYELYLSLSSFIVGGDSKFGGLYDYDGIDLFRGPLDLTIWIVSYINVYWIMFFLFARKIKKGEIFEDVGSGKMLLVGAFFLIIDIVINSVCSFYSSIHYERIFVGLVALTNVVCCILGMSYMFEMYYLGNVKKENAIIKELRKEEINQYNISKETIDLINIKVHDFKHQIRELGKQRNIENEAIENINNLINIYDSGIKTSNGALNVILSEKSLICFKYGIRFSSIIDGDSLSFMSDKDIYSLFGNILDNAIDAVKELPEDKKTIRLKVKTVGNIVSISSKNFFKSKITFVNGLPKSNKEDLNHHGFGLKSMKLISEKYNGSLNININGDVFEISLMFVLKENKDK